MNSLTQRINLDVVTLNGSFIVWVKVRDYDPVASELLKYILFIQIREIRKLLMIQSAIRKPNSKKLHCTKSQRIGLDIFDDNVKKYKLERWGNVRMSV